MHKTKVWARSLTVLLVGVFSFTFMAALFPQSVLAADASWEGNELVYSGKKFGNHDRREVPIPAGATDPQGDKDGVMEVDVLTENNTSCSDYIHFFSEKGPELSWDYKARTFGYYVDFAFTGTACTRLSETKISITPAKSSTGGSAPGSSTAGSGGARPETCESEGGDLAWLLCPVLYMLDGGINFLSDGIEGLLDISKSTYNNDSVIQIWQVMRNIALLILIPMMLLMVIGTALEFGPFDAYTVKKALPRMFFAVMFIVLSLPITQFFVNLSNVVGRGLEGLILSATNSPESLAQLYSGAGGLLFSGMVVTGVAVAGLTGFITFGVLGSLAFVTFIALLIGYLILVVRELLIIVLIMVAPLAILVWIFPDNDKLWKIWKSTFIALLMMFPIIILLLTSGKVFASVISDTQNDFTAFFLKVIAFVAPLFFIPATFKYGLGVFGNIAGVVNDRSRGLFDRQRKYRQGKHAEGWQGFKTGTGKGRMRQMSAVRRTGMGVGAGFQGRLGFGERGAQARSQLAGLAAVEGVMKNPRWSQIQENDDALHALTYRNQNEAVEGLMADRRWARDRAERAAAAAGVSVGYGRSQAIAASKQLATTGTGYANMEDQIRTIARASDGDKNTAADIAGYNNFINKQKGRHDLAPGAGALIGAVHDNIDGKNTSSPSYQEDLLHNAWNSGSLYTIANGKSAATQNLTSHWMGQMQQGLASGNAAQIERSSTALKEMKAMLPNASGENQRILNDTIERMQAMQQDHYTTTMAGIPGSLPPGTAGPKPQAQIDYEESMAQINSSAERRARTYERPDPNIIT